MYVYKQTEPGLYTVGYYEPSGKWYPESDHSSAQEAADKVHYLNGSCCNHDTPQGHIAPCERRRS